MRSTTFSGKGFNMTEILLTAEMSIGRKHLSENRSGSKESFARLAEFMVKHVS